MRSAASAQRSAAVAPENDARVNAALALATLALLGLVLRLAFIGAEGFKNDVQSFEAWTLTLTSYSLPQFFGKAGFADYPPGYFFILWLVGHVYKILIHADPSYAFLKFAVKLPAILMDLVDGMLMYVLVRRFSGHGWALAAAAFFIFNPATIFISAYWGQVDSVAAGVLLGAIVVLLSARQGEAGFAFSVVGAWLLLGYSILIKPPAVVLVPLFVAWAFVGGGGAQRRARLVATGYGIGAAVVLAYLAALAFHPVANPVAELVWLFDRYGYAKSVYPYNSVNAFNLYAVFKPFWQPDTERIVFLPQAYWGIVLFGAAAVLIVARYLQRRDDRAFLEAALLLSLAFFMLSTRMHERYVFNALLFACVLVFAGRRYLVAAVVLSLTLLVNLAYSLAYLHVVEQRVPGVDAADLWPLISHPLSAANVVVFFALGYLFLGAAQAPARPAETTLPKARSWFSPAEGIARMTRLDYVLASGFALLAFAVCVVNYWKPAEKIFDEIYFARAGEEYLRGITQFEWTHPPFAKLVIAVSMSLFGGLKGLGDTAYGWRFLNIAIGSLEVALLYAFAKRLTASTLFSSAAALFLAFDGFHFVEARIATGEITISTLILVVLYALYRYWIAAQIRLERVVPRAWGARFWLVFGGGSVAAAALAWIANFTPRHHAAEMAAGIASVEPSAFSYAVAFAFFEIGAYLVARTYARKTFPATATLASYADGTVVASRPKGSPEVKPPAQGAGAGELSVTYARDGSMRYVTPGASAVFSPAGTVRVGDAVEIRSGDAKLWLYVMTVAAALLISSKWNGMFDFAVAWLVIAGVSLQRFLRGRALYGNPRGFPVDVAIGLMLFVAGAVYVVTYVPFFALGHNLPDLLALQQQMFYYHDHLHATHPYSSHWWQWPIMQVPISYYYHDFRIGLAAQDANACCVAEILALPNPLTFLLGLISVPFVGWLAWCERNKGYALLVIAYALQWLPWVNSPRLVFEYHFFPNLALIVLCDAILLQRIYAWLPKRVALWGAAAFALAVVGLFAFFYPVLAGAPMTYAEWQIRMWPDMLHVPNTSWILPPR